MREASSDRNARQGFTLVELFVVILIIGVLAALGVPRLIRSAERAKAAEAFAYLAAVRAAQGRYHAREGTYAPTVDALHLSVLPPRSFVAHEPMTGKGRDGWSLTLTRAGASAGFGPYTVVFTQDGYDPASTVRAFPDINPTGKTAADRPRP